MLTVKQACQPRPGTVDPARRDTVLDLGDLVEGRIDADQFFAEYYITEGMKTLLTEGYRRLEAKSSQGVFKLTQAMGGVKTHNLLALGLLARGAGAGSNPIETIIEDAVRTASNVRVPAGLGNVRSLWLRLGPEDRLYLKGLEVESHSDYRASVYQEFARGFGVRDYRALLHTGKANETRLKTATELGRSDLGNSAFRPSLVRHALYATWRAAETEDVAESLTWLRDELPDYWNRRQDLTTVLRYFAATDIDHWRQDAAAARLVAGAVENDHV